MKQKLVRVPFDVELAKKITNGEIEGRIVTRNGRSTRIICFDAHCDDNIIALIEGENGVEYPKGYVSDGLASLTGTYDYDLMLEILEYLTFKDGDIIAFGDKYTFIGIFNYAWSYNNSHSDYVVLNHEDRLYFNSDAWTYKNARYANEKEKQKLIDALKESKEPRAKEYLKRFFSIEENPKYKFKPFDKVICRNKNSEWYADMFSHMSGNDFQCIGGIWDECILYNEQTAHLLGTTDNWE